MATLRSVLRDISAGTRRPLFRGACSERQRTPEDDGWRCTRSAGSLRDSMRKLSSFDDLFLAEALTEVLYASDIVSELPCPGPDNTLVLWIESEPDLDRAHPMVEAFVADPDNPRYDAARGLPARSAKRSSVPNAVRVTRSSKYARPSGIARPRAPSRWGCSWRASRWPSRRRRAREPICCCAI